eukprot:COSAG01_NODE_25461_length_741_cov_1.606202_2_plen_147_part_00
MEFKSRKACIEHYQEQYPNLPRYMIEMALNYDLSEGATNEKPLTGKQKRKRKQKQKQMPKRDTSMQDCIQDALKTGKPLEIDGAKVIDGEYELPPFVQGYISVDGMQAQQAEQQAEQEQLEQPPTTEGEIDDFLAHRDEDEQNAAE